jgi:hypothetical protein
MECRGGDLEASQNRGPSKIYWSASFYLPYKLKIEGCLEGPMKLLLHKLSCFCVRTESQ